MSSGLCDRYLDRMVNKETGCLYIVMEHCGGGDLLQLIKKYKSNGLVLRSSQPLIHVASIALGSGSNLMRDLSGN